MRNFNSYKAEIIIDYSYQALFFAYNSLRCTHKYLLKKLHVTTTYISSTETYSDEAEKTTTTTTSKKQQKQNKTRTLIYHVTLRLKQGRGYLS